MAEGKQNLRDNKNLKNSNKNITEINPLQREQITVVILNLEREIEIGLFIPTILFCVSSSYLCLQTRDFESVRERFWRRKSTLYPSISI